MQAPIEINTQNNVDASVIWLHGLGADGHDFEPLVHALNLPSVRFILPNAPLRAVTVNHGYVMPAWYDIVSFDHPRMEDEAGIRASQLIVDQLIALEIKRGIAPSRIVIAGFSQGGAIALQSALRYPQTLAGVLALSTYLPLSEKLANEANTHNLQTPILMAHGTADHVIPMAKAMTSRDILLKTHPNLTWHEYMMAHSVSQPEIDDILVFIKKILHINY